MKRPATLNETAGLFCRDLLNFSGSFLAIPFASEGFLCTALFARLQVERMTFDLFDDIFLLNLALKPAQSAFKRFAFLQMHFCQLELHHLPGKQPVY